MTWKLHRLPLLDSWLCPVTQHLSAGQTGLCLCILASLYWRGSKYYKPSLGRVRGAGVFADLLMLLLSFCLGSCRDHATGDFQFLIDCLKDLTEKITLSWEYAKGMTQMQQQQSKVCIQTFALLCIAAFPCIPSCLGIMSQLITEGYVIKFERKRASLITYRRRQLSNLDDSTERT